MRKSAHKFVDILFPLFFLFITISVHAQESTINNNVVSFTKRELTTGFVFDMNKEREELLTDESKYNEERTVFNGKFKLENRFWNLLDNKQDEFYSSFEIGPFGGYGNWIDSSFIENTVADQSFYGVRTTGKIGYKTRFYYDPKTYTLVDVGAWGQYDLYKQNSDGTTIDSFGVATDFDNSENSDRFRYGFRAKAGWGFGRLSPMNHLMTADYLLRKYYPRRNFSDYEIAQFAQVIADIKHDRSVKAGHALDKEMLILADFIKNTLVLASPESVQGEWQFSEFDPRYQGQRLELGPHFQYYNQEPDFIWGGYILYENSKYQNVSWNRNFSAGLKYNSYKKHDWITGEINIGWSYYAGLKSQIDFGVKYVPAYEFSNSDTEGGFRNNAIPYLSYFTQLNSKSRVKLDFSWRFADDEQFVLPGPDFSLAIYRSRY